VKSSLPFPAYAPDQTDNSGFLQQAQGVIRTATGYRPIKDFLEIGTALGGEFKGGASFVADDGTSYLLAGTVDGLERYASGGWTDLVTGMTITDQWRFASFGNFAIGVNGSTPKVVDLNAGTASTLTDAPDGKCIAIVGDYVVIGQDSSDLLGIYTSGFNDHTEWDAVSADATIQPMLTGGEVMGLAGGEYGVILQRRRLVRMNLTGDGDAPFAYDEITTNVGCASKGSVEQYGRSVFFLSDAGFMALEDGQALRPIGNEKIDRLFQELVPAEDYERIFAAVDPKAKIITWAVTGSPGHLFIYNFSLGEWSYDKIDIDGVFSGFTSSDTLEDVSTANPDIDAMTISLDDPRFRGGSPQLYAVQDSKAGVLGGDNRKAIFEMPFVEPVKGRRARYQAIRPITDCTSGLTLTVDVRERLGDAADVNAAGALRASGVMPIRASGRYMKLTQEIAASSVWTYADGVELEYGRGGER